MQPAHTRLRALLCSCALAVLGAGCAQLPPAPPETAAAQPGAQATELTASAPEAPPPVATDAQPPPPALPHGRLDPLQDAERVDLWERVRAGFGMPDLDNDLVHKWEQFYAGQPDYVQRMTTRGGRYLFHIVEEVERREMPAELALLPFIESAFNPQARSRAAASGMWQFMPATGKDFELRQNLFRDDRRDVLASTRAALGYLQRLYAQFGDWQLALAAYNWGPGNVQRAIDRNRRAGRPTDYASLRLPDETRNYLPKLQAVKNIVQRPEAFALSLPELANHPYFVSVAIERDIDVELAATLAGLSVDEFEQLNPQHNKPVILAAATPQVLLPYDNANRFLQLLPQVDKPLASWTAWVAPRTLKPAEAAQLVGMQEAELRDINAIPPRMLVKAGSTLLVPRAPDDTADVAGHIADNGMLVFAPESRPLRRVAFKAGRQGDSVAAVASRYRVAPEQVAQWNPQAAKGHFKAGQQVVVMLPAAPARHQAGAPQAARMAAAAGTPKGKNAAPPKAPARARAAPARAARSAKH